MRNEIKNILEVFSSLMVYQIAALKVGMLVFFFIALASSKASAQDDAGDVLLGIFGTVVEEIIGNSANDRIEEISRQEEQHRLDSIERQRQKRERERQDANREHLRQQAEQDLRRRQRDEEDRLRQEQTEKQKEEALASQQKLLTQYILDSSMKPCLSKICVGMTIEDVLSTKVQFIDGPDFDRRAEDAKLEHMRSLMGASYLDFLEAKAKLRSLRRSERSENEERARSIKGISPEEQDYIGRFLGSYFDNRALSLYSKAKHVCEYFDVEAKFISRERHPVRLYFAPLGSGRDQRLAVIEIEYDYAEIQVSRLREMIAEKYESFNIGLPSILGNFHFAPDILLAISDGSQSLFLLDRRVSVYVSELSVPHIRGKIRDLVEQYEVEEYLSSQDGCLEAVSLE